MNQDAPEQGVRAVRTKRVGERVVASTVASLFLASLALAQAPPPVEWEYFGEPGRVGDVMQASDGDFVFAGTRRVGDSDFELTKISPDGSTVRFSRVYRPDLEGFENQSARAVIEVSTGGYLVVGTHRGSSLRPDIFLVRTDANGDVLWEQVHGTSGDAETLGCVLETPDGGFLASGRFATSSGNFTNPPDFYAVKISANGDFLWGQTYGGELADFGGCLTAAPEGGYVLAGFTNDGNDVMLVKIDEDGNELWQNTISLPGAQTTAGNIVPYAGGYALCGVSYENVDSDSLLMVVDANGQYLWHQTYGGDLQDTAVDLVAIDGEGFVLAGGTRSFGGNDGFIVRTDPAGNLLWQAVPQERRLVSTALAADDSVIVGGSAPNPTEPGTLSYVLKLEPEIPPQTNTPPVPIITVVSGATEVAPGVYQARPGTPVSFSAAESFDPDEPNGDFIRRYHWKFSCEPILPNAIGDDFCGRNTPDPDADCPTSYTWCSAGTYCVQLKVTDTGNGTGTEASGLVSITIIASSSKDVSARLHVFDVARGLFVPAISDLCLFDSSKPTAVIVHGWNPLETEGCGILRLVTSNWDGDLNYSASDPSESYWVRDMASLINAYVPESNVLAWYWLDRATAECPPGDEVYLQKRELATNVARLFEEKNYADTLPVHFLGHSLGAHIVAWAAADPILMPETTSRINHVTMFDPPTQRDGGFFNLDSYSNICNPITALRNGTYTESVTGPTHFGGDNAHLLVNPPKLFEHATYLWYMEVLRSEILYAHKVCLLSAVHEGVGRLLSGQTLGFATSPIVSNGIDSRPSMNGYYTVEFSNGGKCSGKTEDAIACFEELVACTGLPPLNLEDTFDSFVFTRDERREQRCTCNNRDVTCELLEESQELTGAPLESTLAGDANCDAVVSFADVTHLISALTSENPTDHLCLGADANCDALIDEQDVVVIVEMMADLTTLTPCE